MWNDNYGLKEVYKDAEWVIVKGESGTWVRIAEIGEFSLVAKWIRTDKLEDGYVGFLGKSVAILELDLRTENALTSNGLQTIGKLCAVHSCELKKMPNIGKITFKKIIAALDKHNLKLKS